ncbi:2Fe-2S iron-sulfur cluster-binding protein [Sphingomonas sp. KR1UV-12]|uniref:2Fe-2S iron-sulfur cluster-binding protein n=1 Tax=Sphingomonas aurea TaxID=3063994 RepID=A0ABT9EGA8_9SPHN|nr:2Fe-2S iron-sulfur cluster-binding protein [Sphingomonas sp. KR1UV-12]MDP1026007.1 2Fe-2S iron-sulfur cluster-binding protein [Sphingomonas sp. KR1UV-12]
MIRVRFIGVDGVATDANGTEGQRLLDLARNTGQPLEGTCNGDLACATCHVIVAAQDAGRLPPPSAEEEDMLDFAPGATRTSRLSCQIILTAALDGLEVRVP